MTLPDWLDRRTALVVFALITIPGWLLVLGGPHRVWADASAELLRGASLYELDPTAANPHSTRYVYLPIFGMANAALAAIPTLIGNALGWSTSLMEVIHLAVAGLWGYIGYGALAYVTLAYARELRFSARRQAIAVVCIVAFPMVFVRAAYAGSELVLAALVLATAVAWRRERFVDVGLFASLATFKFTGLPALAAVVLFVAIDRDRRTLALVVLGAAVGQLPNLLYFTKFPDDFAMIVANKGALSTYAYRITDHHVFLLPVEWLDATAWYIDAGLPVVILVFTLLAVAVARRTFLLPGLLVAMFPMAYLLPAERRYLPVVAGLLVLLVMFWERRWARLAVVAILTIKAHIFVVAFVGPERGQFLLGLFTQLVQAEVLIHGAVLLTVLVALHRPTKLSWPVNL